LVFGLANLITFKNLCETLSIIPFEFIWVLHLLKCEYFMSILNISCPQVTFFPFDAYRLIVIRYIAVALSLSKDASVLPYAT